MQTREINKTMKYCFLGAVTCWLIPFLLRIFFIGTIYLESYEFSKGQSIVTHSIAEEVQKALDQKEHKKVFKLIFTNNIKGCLLNIINGALLSIGTIINLLLNGFYSADVFVNCHKMGMSINAILKTTLPHSFELIGLWLSGAVGFYISWNILRIIRGKETFSPHFFKTIGISIGVVFLIILSAAYVETYISTNIKI